MDAIAVVQWVQDTPLGVSLREASPLMVQITQLFHVLGLVVFLASVLFLSLRLLGWVLSGQPVALLSQTISRFLWVGLFITLASGLVLFLSAPVMYAQNAAFGPKMAMLLLAALLQISLFRKVSSGAWSQPALGKAVALASVGLWFGVSFAGRAIGYV
jgi:hypothetical protein